MIGLWEKYNRWFDDIEKKKELRQIRTSIEDISWLIEYIRRILMRDITNSDLVSLLKQNRTLILQRGELRRQELLWPKCFAGDLFLRNSAIRTFGAHVHIRSQQVSIQSNQHAKIINISRRTCYLPLANTRINTDFNLNVEMSRQTRHSKFFKMNQWTNILDSLLSNTNFQGFFWEENELFTNRCAGLSEYKEHSPFFVTSR